MAKRTAILSTYLFFHSLWTSACLHRLHQAVLVTKEGGGQMIGAYRSSVAPS